MSLTDQPTKNDESQSEYSDDGKVEQKKVDGRRGRKVRRRAGGQHTPEMQAKIEKMWRGRDLAVIKRREAKKRLEEMEKKLKQYELKEVEEGIYRRVRKELEEEAKNQAELLNIKPKPQSETRAPLQVRRDLNPTPPPEPNPFSGYF